MFCAICEKSLPEEHPSPVCPECYAKAKAPEPRRTAGFLGVATGQPFTASPQQALMYGFGVGLANLLGQVFKALVVDRPQTLTEKFLGIDAATLERITKALKRGRNDSGGLA